jgi:hypothetical protein
MGHHQRKETRYVGRSNGTVKEEGLEEKLDESYFYQNSHRRNLQIFFGA